MLNQDEILTYEEVVFYHPRPNFKVIYLIKLIVQQISLTFFLYSVQSCLLDQPTLEDMNCVSD